MKMDMHATIRLLVLIVGLVGLRGGRSARKAPPPWARRLLAALGDGPPPARPGEFRWWGDVSIPALADQMYYLVAGAIGAGKTNVVKALLRSIVPYIAIGSNQRMLMFDPKPPGDNLLTVLYAMQPRVEVVVLTPSDVRSPRIRLPLGSPAEIRQTWAALAPVDPKATSGKFFEMAVQKIASSVAESLWRSKMDNDLTTVCQVLKSEHSILQVLARHPETRSKLRYFERPELAMDVMATVEDKLDELMVVAGYWAHAAWEWSVEEFLLGPESIAFMGVDARIERALAPVRRALYKNLSEGILGLPPGDPGRRIWLPMDEMHTLGSLDESLPVPGLDRLATLGRSMGAVLISAIQHPGTMDACYGKELAQAILDQFGNVALLRASGASLDAWECERLGAYRRIECQVGYGETTTKDGRSRSHNRSYPVVERSLVPKGAFQAMPAASRENGIHGYYASPAVGIWKRVLDPAFVDWLPRHHPHVPPYVKRPVAHETLPELDCARFGIRPPDPGEAERNARAEGRRRAAGRRRRAGESQWPGPADVDAGDLGPA